MSYGLEMCSSFATRTEDGGGERQAELSALSVVTELMSYIKFHFNNIGQFITRTAIFTVVVSTQQEQNPRHGLRCKENRGS
jgi:hypothetical protein